MKPPVFAQFLLKYILKKDDRFHRLGDFEEVFQYTAEKEGQFSAWRWYWFQVFRSIPNLFSNTIFWSFAIVHNYFKIAIRNIKRQKSFSLLTILSLAIGLTAFIIISLYIQYEFSFDKYHKNAENIYRILADHGNDDIEASTPGPLAPTLIEYYPEIKSAIRISNRSNILVSYNNKKFLESNFYFSDPGIVKVFSFDLVIGDLNTAIDYPNSIIISKNVASKYFGEENPINKIIKIENSKEYKITGVFKNLPKNSHFNINFIAPFSKIHDNWRTFEYNTYCLLEDNIDPKVIENKFNELLEKKNYPNSNIGKANRCSYQFQPLTEIHLNSNINNDISNNNNANNIYILSFIGFLILLIGCTNYMNLATARSGKRIKEVGIRKVVGAQKRQIMRQFLGEAIIFSTLAFILSIFFVVMILPVFNSFIEREITLNLMTNFQFIFSLVGIIIFTGIIAGGYPAMLISSFKPTKILHKTNKNSKRGTFQKNILVIFQITISIILIISTFVVRDQLFYIKNTDVGYSKDQIITVIIRDSAVQKNIETVKKELLKNPNILKATLSRHLPNRITNAVKMEIPKNLSTKSPPLIYFTVADYDFLDVFDIKLVQGRNFSPEFLSDNNGAFLFNETAVRTLGWDSPIGKDYHIIWNNRSGKTVGVIKDFNFRSLHNKISPLLIYFSSDKFYSSYFSIKLKANTIPQTLDFLEEQMEIFSPNYPFEYRFFDDVFDHAYRAEQKLADIFGVFSSIAILLACLGLFGLTSFTAEQKFKEIGIRKVLGASITNIIQLLSKEFIKNILIAIIIGWPIAYYTMNNWLENFAYRVNIGIKSFVLATFLIFLLSIITVDYQILKASLKNPIDSLRYE